MSCCELSLTSRHGDLRPISKRPVRYGLRRVNIPIWIWRCRWSPEIRRLPFLNAKVSIFSCATTPEAQSDRVRIPPGFLSDFLNFDPSEGFFSRSGVEGLGLCSLAALFHLPKAKRTVQIQTATTAPIKATSLF